jgi:hypothetical protein
MADDIKLQEVLVSLRPGYKQIESKGFKVLDWGDTTPVSDEDIEAERVRLQTEFDNNLTKQAADKASGNQKLKDLGLSDDEIKAITGQ